jgi:unspecific monooxygenase
VASIVDPRDPAFSRDPYPTWAAQLADGAVQWLDDYQAWLVLGHAEAHRVMRDDEHFTPSRMHWEHYVEPDPGALTVYERIFQTGLFHVDHDDHVRLRRLVMKAFTPRGIEQQRQYVEAQVALLLDGFEAGMVVDLAKGLAEPLPARVIGHMLGVTEAETERFKHLADIILKGVDPVALAENADEIDAALLEMVELLDDTIAAQAPDADNLLTRLLTVEEQGDRLTRDELESLVVTLLLAGSDTTVHAIALGALSLLEHPDQRERLGLDQARWVEVVDELLRFSYIGKGQVRYCRRATTLGDQAIQRGAMLVVNVGAAHHDPAVFDAPAELDVGRDTGATFPFGVGAHFCLGASLARAEISVALQRFFERFPDAELAGPPEFGTHLVLRDVAHLPVRL